MRQDAVEAVTVKGRGYLPHDSKFRHFAFADPAGGSGQDAMTLAIARREGDVSVVVSVVEWRPPFSPDDATKEASDILKEYGLTRVVGDHFGGDFPKDRFRTHGISYERADHPMADIYQFFLSLVNGRRVELLDHRKTLNQLLGLEKATGRTGKDTITHPRNGHDDLVNAVAGACVLAQRRKMLEYRQTPDPQTRSSRAAALSRRSFQGVGRANTDITILARARRPAHRPECSGTAGLSVRAAGA